MNFQITNIGSHGATGTKDTGNVNVISGIHDGDIMASIKDPNMREIVAKESLQYKPNSKNEGPEVSEENKKALANLLEVIWLQNREYKNTSVKCMLLCPILFLLLSVGWSFCFSQVRSTRR